MRGSTACFRFQLEQHRFISEREPFNFSVARDPLEIFAGERLDGSVLRFTDPGDFEFHAENSTTKGTKVHEGNLGPLFRRVALYSFRVCHSDRREESALRWGRPKRWRRGKQSPFDSAQAGSQRLKPDRNDKTRAAGPELLKLAFEVIKPMSSSLTPTQWLRQT